VVRQYSTTYPAWFLEWQHAFYRSKKWVTLRDRVRLDRGMRSDVSGKLITGKSIVDHVIAITPNNCYNPDITLNPTNLQLMSIEEHNTKTFANENCFVFEPNETRNINLF
jgi:predicted ATPase